MHKAQNDAICSSISKNTSVINNPSISIRLFNMSKDTVSIPQERKALKI